MRPAEFEEREFETPLYNQLERGNRNLWAPGQVLEGHMGFDAALFVTQDWLFRLHGYPSYLPGAVLSRYAWPPSWYGRKRNRRLPNFQLNLFVQSKRSWWGQKPSKKLRKRGVTAPYWKFRIDRSQQDPLDAVSRKLDKKALVVYAAPAFHKRDDLYRYTRSGQLVHKSTFPSVKNLNGHEAWYYNAPGANGVANPKPERIQEPSLDLRIRSVLEDSQVGRFPEEDWASSLANLATAIQESLRSDQLTESSRLSEFFDRTLELQRDLEGSSELIPVLAYLTVITFTVVFAVDWYVLG